MGWACRVRGAFSQGNSFTEQNKRPLWELAFDPPPPLYSSSNLLQPSSSFNLHTPLFAIFHLSLILCTVLFAAFHSA